VSRRLPSFLTVTLALGVASVGLIAGPAFADSQSPSTCVTACTAVFTTAGSTPTFVVPNGITSLTVTVTGGKGAEASSSIQVSGTQGGPGGSTTVDLGAVAGGTTYQVTVGNIGEGSSVSRAGTLLVVAGGGGQAGFLGRLNLPDQVSGDFAGGTGGSPTGPGIFAGTDGTTPNGTTENGHGGAVAAGGAAGTGDTNGTDGTNPNTTSIVAGGAGASEVVPVQDPPNPDVPTTFTAGNGGSGYSGGGGGAITRGLLDGDGNPFDVVGGGGGGSGFLAPGLTATAGTLNSTTTGSVTFTYSFPALAATGSIVPLWVPVGAAILMALGVLLIVLRRRFAPGRARH